jgi:hypothetical protein
MGSDLGIGQLLASTTFLTKRAEKSSELVKNGQFTIGSAKIAQTSVSAANTIDALDKVTNCSLTNIAKSATEKYSNEAIKFVGQGYDVLKGCGLAANLLYAGAQTIENGDPKKGGSYSNAAMVAGGSLIGMYSSEHMYKECVGNASKVIDIVKNDPGIAKELKQVATSLSNINMSGKIGQIVKGIGFIMASYAGVYLGEKAGEFVAKH